MATPTIKLKDFCQLLEIEDRDVRYILEQGHVPKGVAERPMTGNHREFGPDQAFWLAIVLKLKHTGLKTPLAARVADFAARAVRATTQNLSWDRTFLPMTGWFESDHQYFVDVGDLTFIRLVTDAYPSREGLYAFPWSPVEGRRKPDKIWTPFVILRLDITQIAKVLGKVDGWICPHRRPKKVD